MQPNLLKKRHFSENLETRKGNPRKPCDLINELSSRNSCKSSNILEIQANCVRGTRTQPLICVVRDVFSRLHFRRRRHTFASL